MNDIIAGDPAPTNPTALSRRDMTARERLQVMIRTTPGSMTVWSEAEVADAFDAYRDAVLAEERPIHRVEVLAEVAERLREADEQAAAVLVDWLMEGESRG